MKDRKNQERGLAKVSHFFLSGSASLMEKATIRVAARALGVTKGTIITYLNQGLLKRIKEDGRIYVSMEEVRALRDPNKRSRVKSSLTTSGETTRRVAGSKQKDGPKRPLTSFGLLENERQYLLKCRAALEAKDEELEILKFEMNNLKQNLEIQASELRTAATKVRELEKHQERRLADLKKTTDANDRETEETRAKLLAVEEELKRLKRAWWKKVLDD